MGRPKKQLKAKEPVSVRFKDLKNGSKSIYLDIYRDGVRSYEFLKLYLIPERTEADKTANALALDSANAIKAQRVREIVSREAGLSDRKAERILLLDWMKQRLDGALKAAREAGRTTANNADSIRTARLHLGRYIDARYKGRPITLAAVDKAFCVGFVQFLKGSSRMRTNKDGELEPIKDGGKLSANSCNLYFSKLVAALNEAVKKGLIRSNPANLLETEQRARLEQAERAYLTADEIRTLSLTPCPNAQVRDAFLFSCMCGLRWSDIKALTWGRINTSGETWQVETRMQKTQRLLYLPLSDEARKFLPERGDKGPEDLVFTLPGFQTTNKDVKKWAQRAGITKDVTFHCARHTFATLMLTLGADLYTTSKLLGHSDIKVTQVYAAIIDKKKQDAVNLTSGLFTL